MFKDREDAGKRLAEELMGYRDCDCIILGIPRGGAIVSKHVADRLKKPWDIIVPRKIGAPFNNEIAIGGVAQDGTYILNDNLVRYFNIPKDYIDREVSLQTAEIKKRLQKYRGNREFPDVYNRTTIIIDDGMATGLTFIAAVESVKNHGPLNIVAAVPVASAEAIDMLGKHVDEIICLEVPKIFASVGQFYQNFEQNLDDDVAILFKQNSKKGFA